MPTYVYHCDSCDTTFERVQRMSDAPLSSCDCGAVGGVHRIPSGGAGLIFKGSGFYITDYKNGSSGKPSESKSSESSSPSSESSSSSGGGCGATNCCQVKSD